MFSYLLLAADDPGGGGGIPGGGASNDGIRIVNPAINSQVGSGEGTDILPLFLGNFIRLAYIGGIIMFTFMLLLGAFEYITAGGDKDKTASAAKRITNALVGLFVLFAVFAIASLVNAMFGIDVLKFTLPTII